MGESKPWVVLERLAGTRLTAGDVLSEHDYYSDAYQCLLEYEQECDVDECVHEIGGRCATCGTLRIVMDPIEEPLCLECGELLFRDVYQRTLEEFVRETLAFDMFWGVSSGAQRKAIRVLSHGFDEREPDELAVMLNYATKNNQLLTPKGLELLLNVDAMFIDSGGYSFFESKGEYTTSDEAYLRYVARAQPDYFALRDYPCEPDILDERDTTVTCHQQLTTEKAQILLELMDEFEIQAMPVAVVQGWAPSDYQDHLRQLYRAGVLDQVEYIGIGTLCCREDVGQIATIVKAVRDSVGPDFKIHGFGVKREALERPDVVENLDSADTLAYSMKPMYDSIATGGIVSNTWKHEARGFLDYYATVHHSLNMIEAGEADDDVVAQQTFSSYGD
ncbi:hypothetical protein HUG10_21440 (plasmid) [Halorarum halophilum]|uniref:DeoxyPurine in DNA protein A domain-containing protein n=1 Tax=Halorarum halophilum TaxID=2743090 RepID=A0A7D5KAU3_9EURY|nr:hypothetical protein [Halobaculum halophilum]QLG30154.1 hypothetical protein HUG10_21440 [Halobaculum halophilum]